MKSTSDQSTAAPHRRAGGIEIQSLSKHYGEFHAIDDVSLSVGAGEFVALLGPSGSGKTTLLMAIAGFVRPDRGRILLSGHDIVTTPANRRGFGVVFQSYALFPHMTVMANVMFPLKVRGMSDQEARLKALRALDVVKLGALGARAIDDLSGGQRQRVALARAIVFEPQVLLMDEPLSSLDKLLREEMQVEIRDLQRSLGITTLYVTHDQREALTMADRIAVMERGKLVQLSSPSELYRRPVNEFVARFIGEAAIIPVTELGTQLLDNLQKPPASARALMIRSEDLCLARDDQGRWITLSGRLLGVVFQGDSWLLQVELPHGQVIVARAQKRFSSEVGALEIGRGIDLHVSREQTHYI
jgi:putative spermidine/putrescine transport system ATP-binding protein